MDLERIKLGIIDLVTKNSALEKSVVKAVSKKTKSVDHLIAACHVLEKHIIDERKFTKTHIKLNKFKSKIKVDD